MTGFRVLLRADSAGFAQKASGRHKPQRAFTRFFPQSLSSENKPGGFLNLLLAWARPVSENPFAAVGYCGVIVGSRGCHVLVSMTTFGTSLHYEALENHEMQDLTARMDGTPRNGWLRNNAQNSRKSEVQDVTDARTNGKSDESGRNPATAERIDRGPPLLGCAPLLARLRGGDTTFA